MPHRLRLSDGREWDRTPVVHRRQLRLNTPMVHGMAHQMLAMGNNLEQRPGVYQQSTATIYTAQCHAACACPQRAAHSSVCDGLPLTEAFLL
jgi:hypothetical protein